MVKTKKNIHICSECFKEIETKEVFIAHVKDREYSTLYCEDCVKKLEIKIFEPYLKPKKKSIKKVK